jgi:hypothetical protein
LHRLTHPHTPDDDVSGILILDYGLEICIKSLKIFIFFEQVISLWDFRGRKKSEDHNNDFYEHMDYSLFKVAKREETLHSNAPLQMYLREK